MTQSTKTRRQKLEEFLAAHPGDAFAQYGLAVECANHGDHDAAIAHFEALLAKHPDYVTGYFQLGQLFARIARTADARRVLHAGIAAAARIGDQHANAEMSAALADLPA
ncbi:MAG TPA: tetratricopeptide repeat protein [Candidatus Acidoferrales bacterium]|nr:tetratricopeptide repeat protein [Candidatus Acidoferrales bacterium]